MDDFNACSIVGDIFEAQVAEKLRNAGLLVYSNLLVPRKINTVKKMQIDLVALGGLVPLTIECKAMTGECIGDIEDKYWTYQRDTTVLPIYSPLRQSYGHRRTLEEHFGVSVYGIVVVKDELTLTGIESKEIVRFSELDGFIRFLISNRSVPSLDMTSKMQLWSVHTVLDDVKHGLDINNSRNKDLLSIPDIVLFCVQVPDGRFYGCPDHQGQLWLTPNFNEATLFTNPVYAIEVSNRILDAGVSTVIGGKLRLSEEYKEWNEDEDEEEKNEFAGMSLSEYADAIGARPW